MAASAKVFAIHALEDLRGALNRFGGEAQESLRVAEAEIRRTLDWIQDRLSHWQNEARRHQELVRQRQAALTRCQASAYHDSQTGRTYVPDCSAYQNALLEAQLRLREAEAEVRKIQDWIRLIQQAAADYQRQAQRLALSLNNDLPNATALLGRAIANLDSYTAVGFSHGADSALVAAPLSPLESAAKPPPSAKALAPGEVEQGDSPGAHPEAAGRSERDRELESIDGAQSGVERGG